MNLSSHSKYIPEGWKTLDFQFKRNIDDAGQNEIFLKFAKGESIEVTSNTKMLSDNYFISRIDWDKNKNTFHVYMFSKGE